MTESELRDAAQRVRRASSALAELDPAEFEQLEEALRARAQCVQRLAGAGQGLEEAVEVLTAARDKGTEMLVRLRLVRAAVQADLQALEREQQLLHGLSPQEPPTGGSVDLSG